MTKHVYFTTENPVGFEFEPPALPDRAIAAWQLFSSSVHINAETKEAPAHRVLVCVWRTDVKTGEDTESAPAAD